MNKLTNLPRPTVKSVAIVVPIAILTGAMLYQGVKKTIADTNSALDRKAVARVKAHNLIKPEIVEVPTPVVDIEAVKEAAREGAQLK
jgi:hypothetical protein